MAWWGGAQKRPIATNHSRGTAEANRLLILHVMQGTLAGTDSWFRNPAAGASAHFGIGKDGTCYQWVDTDAMAWHACNANGYALGLETEGFAGTPMTNAQVIKAGKLLKWAHQQYPTIRLWLNKNPTRGSGLSWHGLGGSAFCSHFGCPGKERVAQLDDILKVARG